ncbi:MAG: sugar phosphate isomerase/epimerase [Alistipes sp.]|nr:sugar phosphate isomerase/epimerase [Alistipes sp.]
MKKILTLAVVALAAFSMMGFVSCEPKKKEIGLQLYSVNRDMKDVDASLAKVAAAGYNVVETLRSPECFGLPADQFKALCDKHGLKIISTHHSIGMNPEKEAEIMEQWREVFKGLNVMGAKYCVIPSFNLGKTLEDLKAVCDYFNKVGALAKEYGLLLGYHNHSFEYEVVDGQVKWEYMIENTNPENVFFQMDVYWTTKGGKNPVDYLKKYPERIKMLHIKDDMVIGDSGKIDFEAIFNQFYANGYTDYVVEQEMPRGPKDEDQAAALARMWDGVAKSAAYLEAAEFTK